MKSERPVPVFPRGAGSTEHVGLFHESLQGTKGTANPWQAGEFPTIIH